MCSNGDDMEMEKKFAWSGVDEDEPLCWCVGLGEISISMCPVQAPGL